MAQAVNVSTALSAYLSPHLICWGRSQQPQPAVHRQRVLPGAFPTTCNKQPGRREHRPSPPRSSTHLAFCLIRPSVAHLQADEILRADGVGEAVCQRRLAVLQEARPHLAGICRIRRQLAAGRKQQRRRGQQRGSADGGVLQRSGPLRLLLLQLLLLVPGRSPHHKPAQRAKRRGSGGRGGGPGCLQARNQATLASLSCDKPLPRSQRALALRERGPLAHLHGWCLFPPRWVSKLPQVTGGQLPICRDTTMFLSTPKIAAGGLLSMIRVLQTLDLRSRCTEIAPQRDS